MADNILKARVRHAYKTDAEWANANPILLKGEIAYSSDIRQTKTGDGTAHWADLEYDVAKPAWHEHDLSEMINKLNANGSIPKDNDYYISQYVGGGTTTTTYQRRPMSALWEYIKAKANSLYTRIEDFNLLKNTVTDNTKVVNRVKNGINSIINSDDSISVNPSINGMGYAIHRGGSGCVKFDGFELPIYQDSIEYLFDGKSSTYLRFESIQDYCDIKQIAWNSTKQYKKGDFVVLLNNGNINSYLLFKALSDNTGKNPLENPSIWYDNYRDSTNTYAGTAILRKILIQVEVVLPKTADWETGYSIYFRAAGQTVRDLLVEAGDINKENWQTEGRISGVCGSVVTIYPHKGMDGKKRSIRLSFYNSSDNTSWTAITQIAITGLVGGLEGTVLNKGGGELYGNVYPHQSNVINLGDSSHKWNAVYANNFKGNADTATKATSATKADSATTATTANKATLASGVENSGTVSDGAARHVWFSNSTDETKRASSDNLKYTPNTQMLTTNVSGNAGSATKLQTIRKVDGVNFDGSADITHYGTCSTAAATAAKTVTLNGFNLATGAKVAVKFTVTNTAANPTLNVNGTGAKSIKYRGAAISTDALAANRIYEFIYDGTDYVFVGDINTDTNTTYGNMTGATTSAAGKAGLVPAPAAGASTRYLRSDGTWQVPPDTTYSDATQSAHGLMSVNDKKKLDGITEGANKITVDSAMSSSSTNPVQNKIVQAALDTKAAKDKGALFVVGTHTTTTNAWTGKLSGVSALYDGLLIDYWVPFTGTSAGDTLNLTLDDGTTTGAKNMYYRGTTRLTTHYSTGYVIRLVYRTAAVISGTTYSGWWNVSSFDSTNTTDISFGNGRIYAGTNGIWRYTLVALDSTGKWQSFVTSSSTGTSKTINTSAKFRLPATIYYYGANNDATNGNLVPSTYNVWQIKCVADLRYSTNCTTTQFTANAPIYLECTLSSDRYFQVTSTCITQTFTKGKYYIYLGNTYSTAYQLCLTSQHPVYYYDGTNLVDYVYSLLDNKSDVGHTHNYAGSSSAGGVANSAAKLSTARNISANDDYIMNFNFDGSGNVSTQLRAYNAIIAVANANNYPYHRFAKLDTLTDSYQDRVTNLLITQDFNGGGWGICRIVLRTNNQSNTLSSASVDWLVRCGLAADSVQIGLYTKDGSTYADAFFKTVGTYWSTTIRNLGSGSRGNIGRTWTFINSSETNNTTTTDKKTSYEVYVSLADAGTALHNQAYTSTITGVDVGTVKYANTSGSATSATKDSANQQINTTYIKGISANGKTITVTKGDNTTSTFTTQDTTYGTATTSANGLMSSTDKSKLDGIAVGATKVVIDSALSSTSTNPVQNKVINTALADKADIISKSLNTLKAETSNTSSVVPDENAIASSPFARDLWHDHFAFLNSHTIQDSQTSTDGTTWTTNTTDLKNLFVEKECIATTILSADIKARRFVLYSNDFSWSSILWYEFGVAYTDPFSNFNILIETSADDKKTWTTVANATVESHSNPHFIKGVPFYGNKYLRFTFTKTTNVTTGIVNLTCIKGLTKRKGDQGRGIEYESPYDWNYNRDIYPWVDNVQNLGSSAKKWKNVYATTFTGALSGNASTATKATQDSAGQQINTTYIKGLSTSGKTITYTKGDNKTGTATISGFVPMEGTTKDNPMTGAIIQSSTDNGNTYLAGYTPSGSRLITSSSSGTRTTELTPSSFTTNLETGDAETSGALDVTFYPQKNKQMIYLGGSSSDWIIRGVGTPVQDGDAVNKNYIDSTLENWSNDLVEELQGLIPVYGTWEDTPVTGNIVFNGKATVTGVKEPSSDSDVATKGYVDRQNSIKSVTLTAAGWTGTTAPYTQAVKVDGITEDDNPVMVSMLAAGATPDTQKAYNKAFGIICSGTGTTANDRVRFSVYSKPAIDITVGLKGV